MKLYCLAAASLMLLGAAVAEEPNLRGVADTFKEQVAEAMANPDDIEMYQKVCNRGACCNSHGPYDALVEYTRCSCPDKFNCDQPQAGDDAVQQAGDDAVQQDGDDDEVQQDGDDDEVDEDGGCAHCQACCGEESDSFLTYCADMGRCRSNNCCDDDRDEEDSEDVEMEGNPNDIEMYRKACNRQACCNDHGPYDALIEYTKCGCPMKRRQMCGGGHHVPPQPRRPHHGRGGCAHCQDCEGVDEESDSFLTYCKGEAFKRRCIRRGCIGGDEPPRPKPQPRAPPKPRGPPSGGGCDHCQACCSYEETDSFLTYCSSEGHKEHCMNNGCCHHHHEEDGEEGGEEGEDGGGGGGGGGCNKYNGNPARCAQNGCLPMGPQQCGPR